MGLKQVVSIIVKRAIKTMADFFKKTPIIVNNIITLTAEKNQWKVI